jgi:competence protein ComEA
MIKAASLIWVASIATTLATPRVRAQEGTKQNPKASIITIFEINRASAEDFEKLPGIGPELARRIVTYREKHGPFRRVEDLMAVRGVGPKKWRAIKPYLRLEGDPHQAKH